MGEQEGLVARIRQMRRSSPPYVLPKAETPSDPARLDLLEARVAHLEGLLEGLQDSVHRESERESKRITELEARIEPAVLAAALSRNARERGL